MWTCVHLFLSTWFTCWYSWWISSCFLSAVMCVFQPAGLGGWSSWFMRLFLALCHCLDRCCVAHNRLGWSGKPFRGHIAVSLPMHPNIATFPSACLHYRPRTGMCCIEVGFLGCLSVRNRGEKPLGTLFYAENPLSHFAVPGHCMDM